MVLAPGSLDMLLIHKLLEEEGLNWSSEFETMRVQGTRTSEDSELSNSLLRTANKVSRNDIGEAIFSPGSKDVFKKLEDNFARLDVVQEIIVTMAEVEFDEEGEKVVSREVMLEEMSHHKFCEDIYDRIDIYKNMRSASVIVFMYSLSSSSQV